jgi:hypothetical protein
MVKEVKFRDRLSQNSAETKNGYKLRPNSLSPTGIRAC